MGLYRDQCGAAAACVLACGLAVACGAEVVFAPPGGEGGEGAGGEGGVVTANTGTAVVSTTTGSTTGATSSSSGPTAFEQYCADMEKHEVDNRCADLFDPRACLASQACAEQVLRPDAAPMLLGCVAANGCFGVSNECVWALAGLPLTAAGQAFFDACIEGGECADSLFCYQPYWLTDEALASSAQCLGTASSCGTTLACFESTALGECSGWLRQANVWWM